MFLGSSKIFRKRYFTPPTDRNARFAKSFRAGFQHCSVGFNSGEYFGKRNKRKHF